MIYYIVKSRAYPEQYSNSFEYGEWENQKVYTTRESAEAYKEGSEEMLGKWYEYAIDVIEQYDE